MITKDTLKQIGFSESTTGFGLEAMQKGILVVKKRRDASRWRISISTKWVDVKSIEQLQTLDKLFN